MDPTLKRRLIGAAILVIAAAILLPMFLSGPLPRQEGNETLPLDLPPAPDRDMSQVVLPLEGDAADPDRIVSVDTAQSPAPAPAAPPPSEQTPPAEPTPSELPPSPADTETIPPPTLPAPAAPSPASQAPPVAGADEGRFWVGLGSYGQSANAERVITAARNRGIAVARDAVSTGGRELIRLRAGPYATRAQAEQARQLLLAAVPDAQPKVEESATAPTADAPAPAADAPARAGAWAVQVGAFAQEANAQQLRERLRGAGYPAFVERRGDSYAVRVGPFVRRTEAEAQRQRLKSGQKLDGLVVSHSG